MLIIVDKRLPEEAKESLESACLTDDEGGRQGGGRREAESVSRQGNIQKNPVIIEFETDSLVYPSVSGHPDIFFCQTPGRLVVSSNLPEHYKDLLRREGVDFITGHHAAGNRFPESVHYNAAINNHYLVHKLEYTDPVILESCHYLKKISVSQGYTRCSLAWLKNDHFVTSDAGIYKALREHGLSGLLVSPEGILLPGVRNGLIGGTISVLDNLVLITGSLSTYPEGNRLREYLLSLGHEILELYDGPLFDVGGILIMKSEK